MIEKIDFKKKDKALYFPKTSPSLVDVPKMKFITFMGKGNPDDPGCKYSAALKIVYSISYAIKLDKANIEGYCGYSIPPLETLIWTEDDFSLAENADKSRYMWKVMLRQPDFIDENAFKRASETIQKRKKIRTTEARFEIIEEGLCVQCMHIGAYDDEVATNDKILRFIAENGYVSDTGCNRSYHEIYLNSPQKTSPVNMKTVMRHPVKKIVTDDAE